MTTATPEPRVETSQDADTARSLAFYETTLKPMLEPEHNGQTIAIHADTLDYEVAPSSGEAMRVLHGRHPEGFVLLHRIGTVAPDAGLVQRMRGTRVETT